MQRQLCCYVSYKFHLVGITACEYQLFLLLNLSEVWIPVLTLSCYFYSKILPVNFFL